MNLEKTLNQLGFNYNKSKTYLACLELGSASASQIAKEARVVRTTVYKILAELENNNLIETDIKNSKKVFTAHNPEALINLLANNKKSRRCST